MGRSRSLNAFAIGKLVTNDVQLMTNGSDVLAAPDRAFGEESPVTDVQPALIRWFEEVGQDQVSDVGGKNASLGEMIRTLHQQGIR